VVLAVNVQMFAGRIYVNGSAGGANNGSSWADAYTSLHDALSSAVASDSIFVAKGLYVTHASDRNVSFALKDSVELFGSFAGDEDVLHYDFSMRDFEMNKTVLSGDITGDDVGFDNYTDNAEQVVTATSLDTCIIDGFTVTSGQNINQSYGAGIYANMSKITVRNCAIMRNAGKYFGGGLSFMDCDTAVVINTVVINNTSVTFGGGGVYTKNSPVTLINSVVYQNFKSGTVSNISNTNGALYFKNSYLEGSAGSDNWKTSLAVDLGGNIDKTPFFIDYANLDVQLAKQSPLLGSGDAMYGANIGQYQGAGVDAVYKEVFVNLNATGNNDGTSWADAFISFEPAIDNAEFYTRIYVAKGKYIPSSSVTRDSAFVITGKKGVEIYGGFDGTETDFSNAALASRKIAENETVLSADFNNDDDGFTNNEENAYHVLYLIKTDTTLIFDGFTISGGNSNGLGDQENGGGAFLKGSSLDRTYGVTFKNCAFKMNFSIEGAAFYADYAIVNLYNCLVVNNHSDDDGAAYMYWWGANISSDIVNTTVTNNWSNTSNRSAVYSFNNTANVRNSIIWNNADRFGVEVSAADKFHYYNCNVKGSGASSTWSVSSGVDMGGNIETDPLYVDTLSGNYNVYENSPMIGAGDGIWGSNIGWDQSNGTVLPVVTAGSDSLKFPSTILNTSSVSLKLSFIANNLIDSVFVESNGAFEIATKDGEWTMMQKLGFKPVDAMIDTAIFVRYMPKTVLDSSAMIVLKTAKAENDTVYLIGEPLIPSISVSPSDIDFGSVLLKDTSAVKEIIITAENLLDNIELTSNGGFEFSTGEQYVTDLTLIPVDSSVNQAIMVRGLATHSAVSAGELIISNTVVENDTVKMMMSVLMPSLDVDKSEIAFPEQKIKTMSEDIVLSISASNLISGLAVVPPDGFLVSKNGLDAFVPEDTLWYSTTDFVSDQMVYVRFAPSEGMEYSGKLKMFADSLDTVSVSLMGTGYLPKPVLTVSEGYLQFGETYLNTSSDEIAYNLTGTDIVGDIVITAGNGFELTFESGVYSDKSDTLILAYAEASVDTTVYVKYMPTSTDQLQADIKHISMNADTVTILAEGSVVIPELSASVSILSFKEVSLMDSFTNQIAVEAMNLMEGILLKTEGAYQVSLTEDDFSAFTDSLFIDTSGTIDLLNVYVRTVPKTTNDTEGLLTISSKMAGSIDINLTTEILLPEITFSPAYLMFEDTEIHTESEMYFILNGTNLNADFNLALKDGSAYKLSLQSGDSFDGQTALSVPVIAGGIESLPVFVRYQPVALQESLDTIVFEGFNKFIPISGTAAPAMPQLSASVPVLNFGNVLVNESSDVLNFELMAYNITEGFEISAPTGFALSASADTGFGSSLAIPFEKDTLIQKIYVKFQPTAEAEYSNVLNLESSGELVSVNLFASGIVAGSPVISIDPVYLDFGNVILGTYSDELSFTVSASDLTGDLLIQPMMGMEVEFPNGEFSIDQISILANDGQLGDTTITVRFLAETEGKMEMAVLISSSDFVEKQVVCMANVIVEPNLELTVTSLSFENTVINRQSQSQEFIVQAANLTSTVTLSASQGFEVSFNKDYGYSSVLYAVPVSGAIEETVYVRFAPSSAGDYNGTITASSPEYPAQTIGLTAMAEPRPTRYFVKADAQGMQSGLDWENAYPSIQEAFGATRSGDSVFVARGVYTPDSDDRNVSFTIPASVKLFGGFAGNETVTAQLLSQREWEANATILSGDLNGDDADGNKTDNSYHVLLFDSQAQSITESTVIDGFYISGGYADGTGSGYYTSYASGVFMKCGFRKKVSPTISNCIIEDNYGKVFGGGLAIFPSTSETECNPKISNVVFRDNTAGQDGGGVYISGSVGNVAPVFNNVEFYGNTAQSGGAIYNRGACDGYCAPVYKNVLVCGNSASYYGGAIYNIATDEGGSCENVGGNCVPEFINLTVVNNTSAYMVDGVYTKQEFGVCDVSFINSIIWNNGDSPFEVSNADLTVSNSIVEGSGGSSAWIADFGTDMGGNYDQDPMFVDENGCDVRLLNGSVAVGNGDQSNGNNIGYYQEAGLEQPPVISLNAAVPAFGNVAIGSISSVYSLSVSAGMLIDNLIVTVPEGYEISLTAGNAFDPANVIELVPESGTVSETEIFIRFRPEAEMQYSGLLEVSSIGALSKTASLSGSGSFFNPFIYVKASANGLNDGSSWDNAYTDLQSALNSFEPNKMIVVAAGVYKPDAINRMVYFNLLEGMKLFGGFAGDEDLMQEGVLDNRDFELNPTVLSGDLLGNDNGLTNNTENSYHVVKIHADNQSISNTTILDGFIIEGGNASDINNDAEGGGILVMGEYQQNASPVLQNLIIRNNSSLVSGGGISITHKSQNGKVSPSLQNIAFINNRSQKGGGLSLSTGFSENATYASDLTFTGNYASLEGGAVHVSSLCSGKSVPVLENVSICSNTSSQGAAIFIESSEVYNGCSANDGYCNPTFINMTVTNNSYFGSKAVYCNVETGTCTPSFINTIVWGNNDGDEIVTSNGAMPSFKNCLINGSGGSANWNASVGSDLGGNIDANPVFVDNANCDFRLKAISPAMMAGDVQYANNIGVYQEEGIVLPPAISVTDMAVEFGELFTDDQAVIKSFMITATDLLHDVVVKPSDNYSISLFSGNEFTASDSIVLKPVSGIIELTEIFVRFVPAEAGEFGEEILVENQGNDTSNIQLMAVVIDVSKPYISLNQQILQTSTTYVGGETYIMGFNINASNLTGNIVVNSSAQLSISNDYDSFSNELVFNQVNGSVSAIVYFKVEPTEVGEFTGFINVESEGAVSRNVVILGEVVPAPVYSFSPEKLQFSEVEAGKFSDTLHFDVAISGLVDDIFITPPAGFEISVGGTEHFTSETKIYYQAGGSFESTVYVRYVPESGGIDTAAITFTSMELDNMEMIVVGSAYGAPGVKTVSDTAVCQGAGSINIPVEINDEDPSTVVISGRFENSTVQMPLIVPSGENEQRQIAIEGDVQAGEYIVWIKATDIDGLSDSVPVSVHIAEKPKFQLDVSPANQCGGGDVNLYFSPENILNEYTLTIDGIDQGFEQNFNYSENGTHTFEVTDQFTGCVSDSVVEIVVPEAFSASLIDVTPATGGPNGEIEIEVSGATGSFYVDYGDATLINATTISGLWENTYFLNIYDDAGCENTLEVVVGSTDIDIETLNAKVYPNPYTDKFVIETEMIGKKQIQLIDEKGAVVFDSECNKANCEVNATNLPDGSYYVMLTIGDKKYLLPKMVKK